MTISILEAKVKATRLQTRMAELGLPGSHAQALELMAAVFGDANWAAMRARLNLSRSPQTIAMEVAEGPCWQVFTMVVNPIAGADGQFGHDMRAYVLARSERDAVDTLARIFDSRRPGVPAAVIKEDVVPLDNDSMMDLSCFAQHLAQQAQANPGVRDCFWALVQKRVPNAFLQGPDALNRDHIAWALFELARTVLGPCALQEHLSVLATVPGYVPYTPEGRYAFFSRSRIQGIQWASA